jgi:hypothetical protein
MIIIENIIINSLNNPVIREEKATKIRRGSI